MPDLSSLLIQSLIKSIINDFLIAKIEVEISIKKLKIIVSPTNFTLVKRHPPD